MIVIVCIDEKNGMMFNHRRQSQDRILRHYLIEQIGKKKLWLNAYSSRQFQEVPADKLNVSEDFLQDAPRGEYCFAEDTALSPFVHRIEQLIVCQWHRTYPADQYLDVNFTQWHLKNTCDIQGSSHACITIETYEPA